MATVPTLCDFGWKAADFRLPATDGRSYALTDLHGPNGTLIAFICNHCPYVRAIVDRLVRDATDLQALGINTVAICSNDAASHPEDGFEPMQRFAAQHGFPFPYLHDETQEVARAYGAVCTPDFFGFDRDSALAYRGRLDASGRSNDPTAARELFDAMVAVARTGTAPAVQHPAVGCSIKWKRE